MTNNQQKKKNNDNQQNYAKLVLFVTFLQFLLVFFSQFMLGTEQQLLLPCGMGSIHLGITWFANTAGCSGCSFPHRYDRGGIDPTTY